jgi:hypothetical protein
MPDKVRSKGLRNGHRPTTGAGLRCSPRQTLTGSSINCDVNAATILLHIASPQACDLTPAEGTHGGDEDECAELRAGHAVGQLKDLSDGKDRSLLRCLPISSSDATWVADQEPIVLDRCRQHCTQQPVRLGDDRLGDTLVQQGGPPLPQTSCRQTIQRVLTELGSHVLVEQTAVELDRRRAESGPLADPFIRILAEKYPAAVGIGPLLPRDLGLDQRQVLRRIRLAFATAVPAG